MAKVHDTKEPQCRRYLITNFCEDYKFVPISDIKYFIYQFEICPSTKKRHLQGYVKFTRSIRISAAKKLLNMPQAHLERCKGNHQECINYCSKLESRDKGPFIYDSEEINVKDPLEDKELYPYQQFIIDILRLNNDSDRIIHWFYDLEGNVGKTALCKHIVLKYKNVLFLNGKGSDILYAVSQYVQEHKALDIVLFHFSRTIENYVSYQSIESVKDGIFFSSKYESKMCLFNSPIVICFANFAPNMDSLSKDRWDIKECKI